MQQEVERISLQYFFSLPHSTNLSVRSPKGNAASHFHLLWIRTLSVDYEWPFKTWMENSALPKKSSVSFAPKKGQSACECAKPNRVRVWTLREREERPFLAGLDLVFSCLVGLLSFYHPPCWHCWKVDHSYCYFINGNVSVPSLSRRGWSCQWRYYEWPHQRGILTLRSLFSSHRSIIRDPP